MTSHDAFGYFARAYGLQFIAPVGVTTDAEASAADVGELIRQIRQERIPAVFVENISDPRLLRAGEGRNRRAGSAARCIRMPCPRPTARPPLIWT